MARIRKPAALAAECLPRPGTHHSLGLRSPSSSSGGSLTALWLSSDGGNDMGSGVISRSCEATDSKGTMVSILECRFSSLPDGTFYSEIRRRGRTGTASGGTWLPVGPAPPSDKISTKKRQLQLKLFTKQISDSDYLHSFTAMLREAQGTMAAPPSTYLV
ncbi:hypothetical protein F5X97DRAFT_304402 [Nemania serpens]|nr:hypothetical protein F5X97DRAFT_304402 [Nemania serpens]